MITIRSGLRYIKAQLGRRTAPHFIFFGLTLIVIAPLLARPGFIFLLDFAPVPHSLFPEVISRPDFLFRSVWWFFDLWLPGGLLQKLFLGVTFFLSGFGMFRFIASRLKERGELWGAYFGGLLYMFNPFVYSRDLVGQWILITAYALVPWFFSAFMEFIERPSYRGALRAALWWTAMFNVNLHIGVISIIPAVIYVIIIFFQIPKIFFELARLKRYLACIACMLVLNGYWMIPLVSGRSPISTFTTSAITNVDIFSFFTRADPAHGVIWNTAAMYGFWADEDARYFSEKFFTPHWFYLFFIILGLVVWGIVASRLRNNSAREKRSPLLSLSLWATLLGTGFIALYLAIGVAHPFLKPSVLWLYDHLPYLKGFREPNKFIALLIFCYAILGGVGVSDILARIERLKEYPWRWLKITAPGIFLVIPLIYSPGMLWGFHGQLRPSGYPPSWFEADRFLTSDPEEFKVLFLPWHQYITLSFAKNTIVNPAEQFFHKPVIAGDNIEFGPIYTQSTRPESRYIEKEILGNTATLTTMGEKLLPLRIKYVILPKESDFMNYSFVEKQKDLRLVFSQDKMRIFLNLSWPE